jgi:hypothetical protein
VRCGRVGDVQLSRRDLLAAGALGALSACTTPTTPRPAPVDPDAPVLAAAIAREQALLLAYDGAIAAHPRLANLLGPLRADHAEHLARLAPAAAGTPPASAPRGSGDPRRALAALERATSAAHGAAALTASRVLAPVLASLSACEASHLVVL